MMNAKRCAFAPLLSALALCLACDKGWPASAAGRQTGRPGSGFAVAHDLVADLDVAEVHKPLRAISFLDQSERRYLTTGWLHFPVPNHKEGIGLIGERTAVVDVALVRPGSLTIRLEMATKQALPENVHAPPQSVEVLWNGQRVGFLTVQPERQTYEIEIPAESQHYGPNRLELMPLYWVRPLELGTRPDGRDIALTVWSIDFVRENDLPASEAEPRVVDDRIVQPANTVVTYAYVLHDDPRLRIEGRLAGEVESLLDSGAEGEVVVSLLERDSGERICFRRRLAEFRNDRSVEIDESLSDRENQPVALSVAFSLSGGNEKQSGLAFEWRGRIETNGPEPAAQAADARRPYNILLVLFDTLRADHTSPYGGSIPTSNIQRLADEGVVFVNGFANSAWTRPSIASILTGTHPAAHRTLTNRTPLPNELMVFPERLEEDGYRTLALSHNGNFSRGLGFARGFSGFVEIFGMKEQFLRNKAAGPEALASWYWNDFIEPFLAEDSQHPFLVYLHDIDPHAPYDAPDPYGSQFIGDLRGHRWRSRIEPNWTSPSIFHLVNSGFMRLYPEDRRFLNALYEGEIAYMDTVLGVLLDRFASRGLLEDTLVIFLSDHGEGFMEHGTLGHGNDLYDTTLRVPLIFRLPGQLRRTGRPTVAAQLADVAPTILDLVGASALPRAQGRSLTPWLLAPDAAPVERPTFAKHLSEEGYRTEQVSVRLGAWKLVREMHPKRAYRTELFNTDRDPDEKISLWPAELVRGKALEQMLRRHALESDALLTTAPESISPENLEPEVLKDLKALGYVE